MKTTILSVITPLFLMIFTSSISLAQVSRKNPDGHREAARKASLIKKLELFSQASGQEKETLAHQILDIIKPSEHYANSYFLKIFKTLDQSKIDLIESDPTENNSTISAYSTLGSAFTQTAPLLDDAQVEELSKRITETAPNVFISTNLNGVISKSLLWAGAASNSEKISEWIFDKIKDSKKSDSDVDDLAKDPTFQLALISTQVLQSSSSPDAIDALFENEKGFYSKHLQIHLASISGVGSICRNASNVGLIKEDSKIVKTCATVFPILVDEMAKQHKVYKADGTELFENHENLSLQTLRSICKLAAQYDQRVRGVCTSVKELESALRMNH